MTVNEAYELALSKLDELKQFGIKVEKVSSRSKEDKRLARKYGTKSNHLVPSLWSHVSLIADSQDQIDAIWKARVFLNQQGICFDAGSGFGQFDWEFDWSFHVRVKQEVNS